MKPKYAYLLELFARIQKYIDKNCKMYHIRIFENQIMYKDSTSICWYKWFVTIKPIPLDVQIEHFLLGNHYDECLCFNSFIDVFANAFNNPQALANLICTIKNTSSLEELELKLDLAGI
jgi:hypothetical protein